MNKLSIIIPVYNEEKTIGEVLNAVSKVRLNMKKEIIIVNDGSKDASEKSIKEFIKRNGKKDKNSYIYFKKENGGKGSAVKKGIELATGGIIIIQDADMEYNPEEYEILVKPIIDGKALVVYGSRRLKKENKKYSSISFFLGGILVTAVTNFLFFSNLTDEPTCYKVFDSKLAKSINLKGNHFEWEPEITAKILKRGIRIKEVPISYYPRSIKEGKKINWKDGVQAIWTLFYWRFKE